VITGDTRPCDATAEVAAGAQLLVHEATFADEEASRAADTGHSTAREAARIAARAGVERLVLTHLSARYSRDFADLLREAREVFPETVVARDGMEVELPYAVEGGADDAAETRASPADASTGDGGGGAAPSVSGGRRRT
jgi:ribonuclease Z